MKKLYKRIRKRIRKLYGIDKLIEMEKFILESYCLYTGEQILLDFTGELRFFENLTLRSRGTVVNGTLYVTNKRNIVQGRIYATGGSTSFGAASRKRIIKFSQQEKCYGYIFPNKNVSKLKKKNFTKTIQYNVESNRGMHRYKNITIVFSKSPKREEDINKLIEILSTK